MEKEHPYTRAVSRYVPNPLELETDQGQLRRGRGTTFRARSSPDADYIKRRAIVGLQRRETPLTCPGGP